MKTLRRYRTSLGGFMTALVAIWQICSPINLQADTLYKLNGANTLLDAATTVGFNTITNYAEGTAFTAADSIVFNNLITAGTTFRVSNTTATNLQIGGLTIGSGFNGAVLNPSGTITIQNATNAAGGAAIANTITLGASGINMLLATQNLTISPDTTVAGNTLTLATSANQSWTVGNGRTLSISALINLANNVTLDGNGTTTLTGAISGAGNLFVTGNALGGATLTLGANNSAWTGALTVSGNSLVNIENFVTAGQNRLDPTKALTLNRGRIDLTNNASAQTQGVASLSLGQGLNTLTRTSTNNAAKLDINGAITRSALGAMFAVNGASLGTTATPTTAANSPLIVDTLNTNGILGTWAVNINGTTDTNWLVNGPNTANGGVVISSAVYTTNNALDTWTTASQNILVNAATTASTASRTINSLKIFPTVAGAIIIDIGAANTLTIDDGQNGGGIIRVGNNSTQIGTTTPGQGFLTAGGVDDSVDDTLHIYNSQGTMTINNVIKDNNTGIGTDKLHLALGGAGSVTLNAANTFTGGITIAAGQLNLGANNAGSDAASLGSGAIVNHGTLLYDKTAAATVPQSTIANDISGVGAFTVNRNTAILSGNNTYQGLTTVGTNAILKAGSATGLSANSRILLNNAGTGTLDLDVYNASVAAIRGDISTNRVLLNANTLTLTGSDLSSNTGVAGSLQSLVTQIYQGTIEGVGGNLIKNGAYTQSLTGTGAISYTGTTTINGGVLQTDKVMSTSGVTVNNAVSTLLGGNSTFVSNVANSLGATATMSLANGGSTWQVNNGFNQSIGALTGVVNSRLAIARGALATNITVTDNGGAPVTFAGVIQETGTGLNGASFTKAGTNTLILTGGNNYSGATTINGGVIQIGAANAVQVISDRSAVVLADVVGAALDLNGNNETIGSLAGGGTTGGNVLLGSGRLTTGMDGSSTTYGGVISGTGSLAKIGNGTLTLTNNNTASGPVLVYGGGLTLAASAPNTLLSGSNLSLIGKGATLNVNTSQTLGVLTSGKNSVLNLGVGAILTSGVANSTATTGVATLVNGSTTATFGAAHGLTEGMLVTGTNVVAGTYVRRVISATSVELSQPANGVGGAALTGTATNIIASQMTGAGGYTKNGTGVVWLAPSSPYAGYTNTGAITINAGTLLIGSESTAHNILSRDSALVVNTGGTLNFFGPNVNLRNYQEVGSLAGTGGTINLRPNNVGSAVLVVGRDDSTTSWAGVFTGDTTEAAVMKTGSGTLTLTGAHTSDNIYRIEEGGLTISGAGRLDDASLLVLSNTTGAIINYSIGANTDSVRGLVGGGRVSGFQPYTIGGSNPFATSFGGNYTNQTGGEVNVAATSVLRVANNESPRVFGGVLSGAGTFQKSGTGLMDLWGANTISNVVVDGGILRLGVYGEATGLGALSTSGQGSFSDTAVVTVNTGGTLDLNGANETIGRLAGSGGTLSFANGDLTLADQNTATVTTVLTGTLNSVLNINSSVASTLTFGGVSNATFAGTYNVGTNATIQASTLNGVLGDTARVNLNATGTQLIITLAEVIGSLAGSGNTTLTAGLSLQEARSGASSATAYSGVLSGAGGLTLSNFGGLTLTGNNTNSGATTLSSGSSLILSYGAGNNIMGTGALNLNGSNIRINSTAAVPAILESVASTNLNAGASSVLTNGQAGINLGAITRAIGGTLNVNANAAATSTANTASGILGGYATFNGSTWAVSNTATTAISGLANGSYTANSFGAGLHTDITAAGAIAGGTSETIRFSGANAADITGTVNVEAGGILVSSSVGANTSTISGALSYGASADAELMIHQYNVLGDLVLTNVDDGIGATNITTAGPGKIIITNDVDAGFGGGETNIGYGYLQLGNGGTAGMVGGAILNNGTLGINRSAGTTFSSVISGTGNIELLGSGTNTFAAANTFQGRVTINGGTLTVTNNAGLGAGATAAANRWANFTTINSGGTLNINTGAGGGTLSELLYLNGGTLAINSQGAQTLNAPILLGADSTITLGNISTVTHVLSGAIIGAQGADLTINGSAVGSTLAFTNAGNRIYGNLTIGANANVMVGNNSAGTLGVTGSISNSGTLIFNSNDALQVVDNTISGNGNINILRSSVYLAGDLSGATGNLNILNTNTNVQLFLGDHDFVAGAPGFANINVSANAGGSSGVRFSQANNLLTMGANITLQPLSDVSGVNNRQTYFIKNNIGTLELTGKIAGEYASGSIDDRSLLEVQPGGLLRVVTDAASNNFMMGLTAGVADTAKAFGGIISLQGDTNTGRTSSNWGYFEITGDANQTISANFTGGGNGDQGGIFIYNSTGTLTLSPGTTATSAADGNTLFNNRHQINRGTVIFNGGAGGGAWRNDGFISVGSGATLQIDAAETTNIGVMKNASLVLNANYTQNGNSAFFSAGQITGTGALILNGNVTNRLYHTNNTFSGGLTFTRNQTQFVDAGSLGSNTITIDSGASTEVETQLLQYVGLTQTVETVNNAINITGTSGNRQKGVAAYGVGQLILAGTVTVSSGNLFNLRGSSTGINANNAPFATWTTGIPTVSGQITGAGGVLKEDGGSWYLSNATNNFTGNIEHRNGRLVVDGVGALSAGTAKTYNLGSGGNTGTMLEFSSAFTGGTLSSTFEMNLSGGNGSVSRIVNLGSGALIIQDPTWASANMGNGNTKTLVLGRFDDATGFANVIEGIIPPVANGTVALTKDGRSTWRLNGVNTYTGVTTVNNGVLQLGNASGNTLVANAAVTVANAFGRGATLELITSESMGALTVAIGGTVDLNANTLTVGENNVAMTNNGDITGTGNLTKTGTGVMTNGSASSSLGQLQLGQNSYTGVTTINGGRIDTSTFANGGSASGFGASTNAASNLRLNGANNVSDIGIRYIGTAAASTDRLFQISVSDSVTRTNNSVWAGSNVQLGINEDAIVNFTNTGDIGFTAASGAATLTLRGNDAGSLLEHIFAPRIIDNPGGGATSLNKTEQGVWLVTNTNTYTGTTTVGGGTLVITNASSLGTSAGATTLSAGGAGLALRNNISVVGENATITGDGAFIGSDSGANSWTGNLVLNQNGRVYAKSGASFEITGAVSSDTNGRSLSIYDAGTVILSGTNTSFLGGTTVGGGVLRLNYGTNDTSKLADGSALTFGGTGLATLSGGDDNNKLATRQVYVTGGTLEIASGAAGAHEEIVSATTINAGASRVIRTGTGTAKLRMNVITRNVGGVLDFGAGSIATTDTNNVNSILGGWATINKTDWAVSINAAAADTNITALGAYNNDVYASGNNTDVLLFTAPGAAFTTNSIRFNAAGGGTLTLSAGNNNLQSGGILMTAASGAVTIGGGSTAILRHGTTAAGVNAQDLIIHQHSANDLTIDVQIGENVTGVNTQGLTKTGSGKVILTQDNTFRGTINLLEGTLQVGNGGSTGTLGLGGSTFNPVIFGKGATLIFNTTKATEFNMQTISGEGVMTLASTNTQAILLDDDNSNFIGTINVDGGFLNLRGNNNALGNVRGAVVVNSGGTLQASASTQTFSNLITFNQGATLSAKDDVVTAVNTNSNATFNGRLDFENTTSAGMTVSVGSSTLIPGTYNALTLSGIILGDFGFTKTGNGRLTLSGQNIFDGTPTLNGQVIVSAGELFLANQGFVLGGYGVGNETIVQSGATLDLRDADLNFGDNTAVTREIVQIAGTGVSGTGALRNTTGTAGLPILHLLGNASVGGTATLDMSGFDTDVSPGFSLTLPVIDGNGFELTKVGTNDFRLLETTLTDIGKFIVSEGEVRAETRSQFPFATNVFSSYPLGNPAGTPLPLADYPHTIFDILQVPEVQIVYGGPTVALDGNGTRQVNLNAIVGARLDLFRQHGAHHTSNITAFGAASGTGGSYLELNSDTLPKVYTFWDGTINLTGMANGSNTFFNIEGGGAGTGVGNTIVGTLNPDGDQVVNPSSMLIVQGAITGTGGVTKIGSRELRLTGNNTFTGDFVVMRQTANAQPIDPAQNESYANGFSASLYGQGTLANTSNIVLERRGMLRVINHADFDGTNVNGAGTTNLGTNLANRINDAATIKLRDGFLIFDSGNNNVTETLGTVRPEMGNTFIVGNLQNGTNKNTTLTINSFARQAGSTLTFTSWDSTSTFGTTAPVGDDSFRIATAGTGLTMTGAGGATSDAIAKGVFGGLAVLPISDQNIWANGTASTQERNMIFYSGRDFMTLDSGYLRPLDDSEYYTDTTNMAGAAGQNLNLSLPHTSVLTDLTVNSLRFGNLNDNLNNTVGANIITDTRMVGWQQYANALTIDDDKTLSVSSGMILFANMGQGMNQDMQSYINGGTLDFGANEGIIYNVNGWYRTSDGSIQGNAAFIRSTIAGTVAAGSVGITKSGLGEVYFDGLNTYTGLTKVANGALRLRSNMALGAGGTGNGIVIEGSGSVMFNIGVNLGMNSGKHVNSALANNGLNINANREDTYVGILSSDNQIFMRSNDSVNRHYGNVTLDNVDSAGFTGQGSNRVQPRLFLDGGTTLIVGGNIGGGNTAVSEDTYYNDARGWSMDGSGSGWLILQGSVGDKLDGSGNAISVTGPVTNKPTGTIFNAVSLTATTASTTVTVQNTLGLWIGMPITGAGIPAGTVITNIAASSATAGGTITLSQAATIASGTTLSSPSMVNENEVLRTSLIGSSDHMNVEATQQWKAVGRIELMRGFLRYTGDGDFYDSNTLALINGSEGGNNQIGFQIGGGAMKNDPGDNSMTNFLLTKAGQSFGVNNWTITTNANNNQGAVMIGGENESGTVRYGPASVATSSTIALGRNVALYANAGGTVDFYSRFTGGSISKVGRGTVNLFGNNIGGFTIGNVHTVGGELVLDYTLVNNVRANGDNAVNFNGGVLRLVGNAAANTTQAFANANDNNIRFRIGGSELVVQSTTGRTTTLNMGRLASATDGAVITRDTGGTINFVEYGNGGTSVITLAAKTGLTSNALMPWATYGTAARTATDFAMVDTAGNNVSAFSRAADEYNNDVSTWAAGQDVSENSGSGFRNNLAASLTVNSVRFDANADSTVNLGANTLTVHGSTYAAFAGGGILVSSNVGSANKTITGGVLTTVNNGELILHHYGSGNLNIASQIGAAGAAPARVIVTGPSVTGAAQLSNWSTSTTGQVVLTGANETAAVETRWLLNGSVLSIDAENRLGKTTFAAATADAVYMNGGALRWTGAGSSALDVNRGFTIGGNGGVIDVVDGSANLQITGDIVSENWLNNVQTGAANQYIGGDLIKMGAGTLTLTGGTDANQGGFTGMIDVREGTLRLNGNNAGAVTGTQTISILGDNRSSLDGTVFRNGTNFEIAFGPTGFTTGTTPEWRFEENVRFEGNNTIRFGIPGATNRTTHMNGVIDLAGDVTVDVVSGMTARFNQSSGGYMTGTGDVTKVGQGALELRDNNVLWSGALNVYEGTLRLYSAGLPGGVGSAAVTLGSTTHQGIADLQLYAENNIVGTVYELFQDINVIYNPMQTKRITFGADSAAGNDAWFHGDITLSDNLGLYMAQGGRFQGGTYNNMYFNGDFKDDTVNNRSGNITVHADDTNNGAANNQQNSEGKGYFVFRGDNSGWSGDLEIGLNTSFDQDEMTVVRLENVNALTSKNDVLMRGSSTLQVAGNNISIGSLITNNGSGATAGTANDGTGNFVGTTGSSAFIENASTTAATITINQTTPSTTEALWDVQFRDGQLPSHVLDNSDAIGAALSVTKAGNGWATISVDNTYTGTTTVSAGILQVGRQGMGDTGAVRGAAVAGLSSAAGSTVAGTGVIQGATVILGQLRPGDEAGGSMGTLTLNGNASLGAGSLTTLQIQRSSYTAMNALAYDDANYSTWINNLSGDSTYGHLMDDPIMTSQHDQLRITGGLTLTATGKVVLENNGYNATAGDVFNLMDWATITAGSFNVGSNIRTGAETGFDLELFELGDNFRWDVSQFTTSGVVVVVVPEPSRMLLLMFGLMALFFRRRRSSNWSL